MSHWYSRVRELRQNRLYLNPIAIILIVCACMIGCGSSSSDPKKTDPPATPGVSITQPVELSGDVKTLSELEPVLDSEAFGRFIEVDPNGELRCAMPDAASFTLIADQLGGFRGPYRIPVEKDATTPRLFSGFLSFLENATMSDGAGGGSESVDIQRPDKMGRVGNTGFYLSDAYGLIMVNINENAPQSSEVGCALALPGLPKNFILRDNSLIVIVNSMNGCHSGLLQFEIEGNQLSYTSSRFFENQTILDARLFNDTLAVYTNEFEAMEPDDSQSQISDPSSSQSEAIAMDPIYYPYRPRVSKNHQLKVFEIFPELHLTHTEIFLPQDIQVNDSENRFNAFFNSFISASGEYLIVTESQTEDIFQYYETRYYPVCTNYEQKSYTYCTTNWKHVPNPDYVPPETSGVFRCNDTLMTCLKNIGPRVSKYIRVPDGQTCSEYTRNYCTAYESKSWEYPVYEHKKYTKFHIFRFQDNQFYKLDDTIARVSEGNLETTDEPFRIEGLIEKHDHLMFKDDIFYAVTKGNTLSVFTIQGNSPIHVTALDMGYAKNATISTQFTPQRIYVSESAYMYSHMLSEMQTINIQDPIEPFMENQVSIPAYLDQLIFGENALIGFGRTRMAMSGEYYYFGTITRFSPEGLELNNLIMGTDYKSYSHGIRFDDQVLHYDQDLGRVFLPYSVSRPFDPEMAPYVNRLSMISLSDDDISEEHTFSLPERPNRSLSLEDHAAFSFSDNYIHVLYNTDAWHSLELFNGQRPSSIYPSREFPYVVMKYSLNDRYTFVLTHDDNIMRKDAIDTVDVAKAGTHYCTQERVYFDNDRILIVSESPGIYFDWQECGGDGQDLKTLTGYRITETGFEIIAGQQELEELYAIIELDWRCVLDTSNSNGHEIVDFTEVPPDASCYPADEFYQLSEDINSVSVY